MLTARKALPPPKPGTLVAVSRRGKGWRISYYAADGSYVRRAIGTKAEADLAAGAVRVRAWEARALGRTAAAPLTLGELAEMQLRRGSEKATLGHDRGRWPVILAWFGSDRSVASIRPADIDAFRAHLLERPAVRGRRSNRQATGRGRPDKAHPDSTGLLSEEVQHGAGTTVAGTRPGKQSPPMVRRPKVAGEAGARNEQGTAVRATSPATVNRYLALLSSALTLAVENDAITTSPVRRGHKLRETARDRIATPEEIERLVSAARPALRLAIVLACETVLRRGSLLDLTWEAIDLERRTLALGTSKNGDPIRVPLSRRAAATLAAEGRSTGPVIDVHPDTITGWFHDLAASLGISDLRFHDLRHTAATRLLEAGVPWPVVQYLGGWRSVGAMRRYLGIRLSSARNALDAIE